MEFGERLKKIIKATGDRPSGIAKCIGVNKAVISQWCSGRTLPNVKNLTRLANFFELTIDQLLFGSYALDTLLNKEG